MRKSGFLIKVFLVLVSLGWVDPLADKVREGNELYHRGAYDEALDKYVNAQVESPQIPQLDFNIANTQYQRKKYDEAVQLFDKVVQSGNPEMQAKASFNKGNTLYRQGKMKEAMEYYRKAVDFADETESRGDEAIDALKNDARYNYEYVERKIKENEQQQQQQEQNKEQDQKQQKDQSDQQQDQDNKDKKEEDQRQKEDKGEKKEKDEPQQNQQEPSPENTPKSDQESKEHSQDPSDKDKQKEQQERHPQQPQPTPHQGQRQMSKEEAERFLDALNHAEKETRQMMRDKQRMQHKSVEKDW